jgi:hypothetical protein
MNRIDAYAGQKIIGWKKAKRFDKDYNCYYVLIKLEIGARTRRVQPMDKKCRAARAKVLEIVTLKSKRHQYRCAIPEVGGRKVKFANSCHDPKFRYDVGEIVKPKKKYDPNSSNECCSGIHFFLTAQEAGDYIL